MGDCLSWNSSLSFLSGHREAISRVSNAIVAFFKGFKISGRNEKYTLAVLVVGVHIYYWRKYTFWSRRNIKGPRPLPLVGNFLTFFSNPRIKIEVEWPKKFGKLYGYYIGTKPYLVVADVNVLRQICIKDFDKFVNHHVFEVPNKYQNEFLFLKKDEHWKGMRSVLLPTFSSGKIRSMHNILNGTSDDLVLKFKECINNGSPTGYTVIDVKKLVTPFTLGSALMSFYGYNLKAEERSKQRHSPELLAEKASSILKVERWRFVVTSLFPRFARTFNITSVPSSRFEFFALEAGAIIKERQSNPGNYNDYLQLLLQARSSDTYVRAGGDLVESHHAIESENYTHANQGKFKLTPSEIMCQSIMLLVVATETTAMLVSNTLYQMSHRPEIQDKLYDELMKIRNGVDENGISTFSYEDLTSCIYLDCVLSEVLRLYSPALTTDRVCGEDYQPPGYNFQIPKGTIIQLALYAIHRDPEYWPEPLTFDPDRFAPENRNKILPGSYCPFGVGPRACIGFRFALTEAKLAIAKMVTRYKLSPAPGTTSDPDPVKVTFLLNQSISLKVTISERT